MTAGMLPLKIDGKPIRAPRKKPARSAVKPDWADYKPVHPVDCNHCEQVAYETVMAGEPFDGMRRARRRRKQGDSVLVLCHEHAHIQQEADQNDYADN